MTRRLRRTGGAVLLLCGVCSPTFGAEPEEPRPWRQRLLQGFLEFRGTAFAHPGPTDPVRRRTELRLRWEPEVSLGPRAWLQVELEARTGNAHFHRGTIDRRDAERPHRFLLDLRQATLDLYWPGLDLRIGKQVISWGTADGFSPTDNLNPRDYLDLLWEEKIGVPALKATATLGPVDRKSVV